MPQNTDLELDDSNDGPGAGGDSSTSSSVNWEAKFRELDKRSRGKDQTIDRLTRKISRLEEEAGQREVGTNEELSQLRVKYDDLNKSFKDANTKAAQAETLQAQIAKLTAEKDSAKLIGEKFPQLLPDHMIGDLKSRGDFADDDGYLKYLERQARKASPTPAPEESGDGEDEAAQPPEKPLAKRLEGATPSTSTRVVERKGGKKRTAVEIADDMMALSPSTPNYAAKYEELQAELNTATSI